ncbi:MBL fold metallo-hydrolase [Kordiimonas sp.]|uniref:MBL fold metallo-hydrolase n=1 Tax=Kordiimonas sp. TaxID=1970157 RepID=UPI003A8DDC3E
MLGIIRGTLMCMLFFTIQTHATDMKLVMLGTGTPNADPARSGPSVAVVVGGRSFVVDAGPGLVRRAAAAAANGIPALAPDKLDTAFLTHLHSDHTVGLPDLIFTSWVLERPMPLRLYGPPGTSAMAQHLAQAYRLDVDIRLNGLEPAMPEGHKVEVTEITPGIVLSGGDLTVEAIPVMHGSWKEAYGYKFTSGGKTIVISGDARPSSALTEAAKGVDILVHEVYSDAGFKRREPVWQNYHASFHTSASELAAIANEAKPKLLVLYHQLYWGTADEDLVREIHAAGYDGAVISAKDLEVFEP